MSIDGLRPDAISFLGPTNAPNFYRLRTEGAFTDNARTDYDYTETLPNHTCQVTGRSVTGPTGHYWTANTDPLPGQTLESNRGFYLDGVFGVAHDNALRTGEFVGKTKLLLYATSWNETNGAPDITNEDNGRNKIDTSLCLANSTALVAALITNMATQPYHYAFLHIPDPDITGHTYGWYLTNGSPYCETVKAVDARLGMVFDLIQTNGELKDCTAIILTADHGGREDKIHNVAADPRDYTIPFYVWGPGVVPGGDLYAMNPASRLDPDGGRPPYSAPSQPIRNGDVANLCLDMLRLGSVSGSTINNKQDLDWRVAAPRLVLDPDGTLKAQFIVASMARYDLEASSTIQAPGWTCITSNITASVGSMAEVRLGLPAQSGQFYRLSVHY